MSKSQLSTTPLSGTHLKYQRRALSPPGATSDAGLASSFAGAVLFIRAVQQMRKVTLHQTLRPEVREHVVGILGESH